MYRLSRPIVSTSVRKLATAASSSSSHAPLKKVYGTSGRYAEAVYTSASKAGQLEKVEAELQAFNEILNKTPGFAAYLANPTVGRSDKAGRIGHILEDGKVTHMTRNLFLTLSANGRIGDAPKVIRAFNDMMLAKRGVVTATIVSAEPLKKKTLETVKAAVLAMAGAGKTVDLSVKVDEKLLGGLQVIVGDRFLDLSVASRINGLSNALEGH